MSRSIIVYNGQPLVVRSAYGAEGEANFSLDVEPLTAESEVIWTLEQAGVPAADAARCAGIALEVLRRRVASLPIAPDDKAGDGASIERRSGEALFKSDVIALLAGKRL